MERERIARGLVARNRRRWRGTSPRATAGRWAALPRNPPVSGIWVDHMSGGVDRREGCGREVVDGGSMVEGRRGWGEHGRGAAGMRSGGREPAYVVKAASVWRRAAICGGQA